MDLTENFFAKYLLLVLQFIVWQDQTLLPGLIFQVIYKVNPGFYSKPWILPGLIFQVIYIVNPGFYKIVMIRKNDPRYHDDQDRWK